MAETRKNLCAQIPTDLHAKVREKQEESGKTLSDYITWLLTTFYENEGKGGKNMTEKRTLAVQIPAELFERLDRFLESRGMKKKEYLTKLLKDALDQAEAESKMVEEQPDSETEAQVTPEADV